MPTALVHDFLVDVRGAERVFAALCDLFPDATLFTGVYDEAGTEGRFADRTVIPTYLQRLRPRERTFRALLPLYPRAIEALDLRGYDLVVSSSSAWAHGVRVDPGATHVCYCHNPFRYAWDERDATLAARHPLTRVLLADVFRRWRAWDRRAAQRVTRYVANSRATQERIARCLHRDSDVVHPPVDVDRFRPGPAGEHYVVLSELMAHKRLGVAVEAFNRLGLPLVVIGDGPDGRRLRAMAGPTIRFEGRVPDARVEELVCTARALVVPSTEEFGIAAVEAQAAGRPVVALRDGGLRESVVEDRTGVFFDTPDPDALAAAVRRLDTLSIDPARCTATARRFEPARFATAMRRIVDETVGARDAVTADAAAPVPEPVGGVAR